MKHILILLATLIIPLSAMSKKVDINITDDWEYNASSEVLNSRNLSSNNGKVNLNSNLNFNMIAPAPKTFSKKLGLAVGGAKDTNNFWENIKNGYLPKISSITYEGEFYQHYFDTGLGEKECKYLFCPSYSTAKRINIFTKEEDYFLSVGLNSNIDEKNFKRKKLNLVVVLDISGSMGASFNSYYYDRFGKKIKNKEKETKTKIEIATESIVAMLSHLRDDDRLGIVLFDDKAYRAKPLRALRFSNIKAIKEHILALKERGGTNWSAGYKEALELFKSIESNSSEYENRIIFLTDAMPNTGELKKDRLFGLAKRASENGIHTTFIGIGVDFNNDLVEYVSKTRGANYFSVHSSSEFKKLLNREFDYMVTPLVYDLVLKLDSKEYQIDAVYGSPEANLATGEIMKVNTLFPSSTEANRTKGGIILLKLKKIKDGDGKITLNVSYKDINNKSYSNSQNVKFKNKKEYYDNLGIRKAILISDYVTIMKNWLIDTRALCNDSVNWVMDDTIAVMKRCMIFPPKRPLYPTVKTWERKSCPLQVSKGYQEIFRIFRNHFKKEMEILKDDSLNLELKVLDRLLEEQPVDIKNKKVKKDDWEFVE
jgi:Ca-activated chloride channel family protein